MKRCLHKRPGTHPRAGPGIGRVGFSGPPSRPSQAGRAQQSGLYYPVGNKERLRGRLVHLFARWPDAGAGGGKSRGAGGPFAALAGAGRALRQLPCCRHLALEMASGGQQRRRPWSSSAHLRRHAKHLERGRQEGRLWPPSRCWSPGPDGTMVVYCLCRPLRAGSRLRPGYRVALDCRWPRRPPCPGVSGRGLAAGGEGARPEDGSHAGA